MKPCEKEEMQAHIANVLRACGKLNMCEPVDFEGKDLTGFTIFVHMDGHIMMVGHKADAADAVRMMITLEELMSEEVKKRIRGIVGRALKSPRAFISIGRVLSAMEKELESEES